MGKPLLTMGKPLFWQCEK